MPQHKASKTTIFGIVFLTIPRNDKEGLVMKLSVGNSVKQFRLKGINSILAHAAALMLTGVPAIVCETVLDEVYCSVKKSIERIKP